MVTSSSALLTFSSAFSRLVSEELNQKGKDAAPYLYLSFYAPPQPAVICDQAQQAPLTHLLTKSLIFVLLLREQWRWRYDTGQVRGDGRNESLWFGALFSSLKKGF